MSRVTWLMLVAGLVAVVVVVGAIVAWRSQSARLDDMEAAVRAFEPPAEWQGWTLERETTRGYSPLCIDVRCPSFEQRYLAVAPEGDLGPAVEAALEAMDVGPYSAPDRQCVAGEFCLYTLHADGFEVQVSIDDPFDFERSRDDPPPGFVEIAVGLHAF